jgi:hypothetical protein
MDRRIAQLKKRLSKKARKGFRGCPVGTIACYGPDDRRASKMVVSIVEAEGAEPSEMRKWYAEDGDVRGTPEVIEQAVAFLEQHGVRSVAMTDRIIGCPHEEGIDYEGPTCPRCPFWANRDRWTGEVLH